MRHIHSGWVRAAVAAFALTSLSACDSESETVGPRGGVVTSDDGRFSVAIPEGALHDDVEITVLESDCDQDEAIGRCYVVEPMGTTFSLPAEVSYEFGDMELGQLDTHNLGVVVERDSGWNLLGDRDVDTEDDIVYASATYLSSFALVPVE